MKLKNQLTSGVKDVCINLTLASDLVTLMKNMATPLLTVYRNLHFVALENEHSATMSFQYTFSVMHGIVVCVRPRQVS